MLYYGATWLVEGSSSLARSHGISSLVIGLTVVALGTSAPEIVVSTVSSLKGKSMIALGNVVGSNICNMALVLGLAAIVQPIRGNRRLYRRDFPIMVGISVAVLALSLGSVIGRVEGAALLMGVIPYILYNYYAGKREWNKCPEAVALAEEFSVVKSRTKQVALILTGIAGVVAGAEILVDAAVIMMKAIGVGEKFIGLTIVAFGTSLPELATSVVAAMRKELDLSVGNLVGSNVFNLLAVLGAAALVNPIVIPGGLVGSGLMVDYAVMIVVSLLPWVMLRKTNTLERTGGVILLACYIAYIGYLLTLHDGAIHAIK